jgi:hypothetical protein
MKNNIHLKLVSFCAAFWKDLEISQADDVSVNLKQ